MVIGVPETLLEKDLMFMTGVTEERELRGSSLIPSVWRVSNVLSLSKVRFVKL